MSNHCTQEIGRKFKILSFLATIVVICIHTNYLECHSVNSISWWIGNTIGYLERWAVPFFFLVSGFFFDRHFRRGSICNLYAPFLFNKSRTLLIPYLLWGGIYGTFMITICIIGVNFLHGEKDLLIKTVFYQCSLWQFWDSVIGFTHAPLNGALWYVRILILFSLFAPLWVVMFRFNRWLGIILGIYFVLYSPLEGTFSESFYFPIFGRFSLKINSIGWILLGMGISQFDMENLKVSRVVAFISFVLWGIFALLPLFWVSQRVGVPESITLIHRFSPVLFIVFYWYVGDKLSQLLPANLPLCFSFGFWIYCIHHPITSYVSALRHFIFGHSLIGDWLWQFTAFIWVFIISYFLGVWVMKKLPNCYKVLSGGR